MEFFEHIDEVLGDAGARFLGQGYRSAVHDLADLEIGLRQRHGFVRGRASVSYPPEWSAGPEGAEIAARLGNIDALVLAAQLAELYLATRFALNREQRGRMWIRRCLIRSASSVTPVLRRLPVSLAHLSTQYESRTLGGNVSVLSCAIDTLAVRFDIEHEIGELRRTEGVMPNLDQVLGSPVARYYGEGYKRQTQTVERLALDLATGTASALVSVASATGAGAMGLQSFYLPAVTCLDALVVLVQLAQVLLYRIDGTRPQPGDGLWVREIALSARTPFLSPNPFVTTTRMEKSRYVRISNRRWRILDLKADFQGIQASYSVAQPVSSESRAAAA